MSSTWLARLRLLLVRRLCGSMFNYCITVSVPAALQTLIQICFCFFQLWQQKPIPADPVCCNTGSKHSPKYIIYLTAVMEYKSSLISYLLSPCYGNDRVSKPGNLWKGLLILTQRETTCLKPALTAWPGTFLQGETLTVIYSILYWRGFVLVETSVPLRLEGTSAFAHSMGV